jgi:hypothetical protein
VFPVAAALSKDTASFPRWWGVLDVAMAFVLAVLAFAIVGVAQGKISNDAQAATYRAYRVLIHVIFFLIIVFFLFGDRITWINGLPGIAWRAWLLLYSLPAWLAVARSTTRPSEMSMTVKNMGDAR